MALSATNQMSSAKNQIKKLFLHKGLMISLAVLTVTAFIGYGIYVQRDTTLTSTMAERVYEYTQKPLENFRQKKISAEKLIIESKALLNATSYHPVVVPALLQTSDALVEKKKHQQSLEILQIANEHFSRHNSLMSYFILSRLAVVYEELTQYKDAISVLQRMTSSHIKFMEDKNPLGFRKALL